jgi:hypothetical protein
LSIRMLGLMSQTVAIIIQDSAILPEQTTPVSVTGWLLAVYVWMVLIHGRNPFDPYTRFS